MQGRNNSLIEGRIDEGFEEEAEEGEEGGADLDAFIDRAIDAAAMARNPTACAHAEASVSESDHINVTAEVKAKEGEEKAATAAKEGGRDVVLGGGAASVVDWFRPRVLVVDDSVMNRRMLCRRCELYSMGGPAWITHTSPNSSLNPSFPQPITGAGACCGWVDLPGSPAALAYPGAPT